MSRDCNKCIHHISGSCSSWECDMQTLKDYRSKVIDEFVKKICENYTVEESKGNYKQYCVNIKQDIADIAEQMKGEEYGKQFKKQD